jgi:beta-glucosidase
MRAGPLGRALSSGKISEEEIDICVRRVLELVNRAIDSGIPFDKEEESIDTAETRSFLQKVARESVVLLKNSKGLLPLNLKNGQTLAIIGPGAKSAHIHGGGSASLTPIYAITPFAAIEKYVSEQRKGANVVYAPGAFTDRYLPLTDNLVENKEYRLEFFNKDPASKEVKPCHTMTVKTSLAFMVSVPTC